MNTIENSFDYQMRVNVSSTLTFIHVPSSFQEDPPLLRHKGIWYLIILFLTPALSISLY